MKKKVLLFTPFYTPSIKGGGPIVSTKNIIENLSKKIDFYVVTTDRDLGDTIPFQDITVNVWNEVGNAKVMYIDNKMITINFLRKVMKSQPFDIYYLNSFFSFRFSILPMLVKKITKDIGGKLVVAPRGEFSPGALNLKRTKKKLYIEVFKKLNLQQDIIWHATAESEMNDIETVFKGTNNIKIANNLTANYTDISYNKKLDKLPGKARIIFISRIHLKKNLIQALEFLREIKGEVVFSIYGPIEDEKYWEKCKEIIAKYPDTIRAEYKGVLSHKQIVNTFNDNHFFLFPTLGENYGHVISESLIGGCPIIISDQTPWRNLEEKKAGWDISLDDSKKFIEVIQKCVDMSQEEYSILSNSAFNFGRKEANKSEDIEAYYQIFEI